MDSRPEDEIRAQQIAGRSYPDVGFRGLPTNIDENGGIWESQNAPRPEPERPSPFLKIPNSELMSRINRGRTETPPTEGVTPAMTFPANVPDPNPAPTPDTRVDPTLRPNQSLLGVLKNSSPRSPVSQTAQGVTEGAPVPMGHGFWNKLKKIGQGAVIGMGQQAQRNDASGRGQDLGSLLGAGAAGGVQGGVNPLSIDVLRRQNQIGQAENDQFRQGELEKQRAEAEGVRVKPLIEIERLRQESQRQQDAIERQNRDLAERADYHKATIAERQADRVARGNKPQVETPDVATQNAPEIQGLDERVTGYQAELKQHQDEIATKNAAIRKQAEANYQQAVQDYNTQIAAGQKPAKPKRADFYEEEKNNDKDYLDGTVEKVNTRIKELQDAIKAESGNLNQLKTESRKAGQKPGRQTVQAAPQSSSPGGIAGITNRAVQVKQYADQFFGGDVKKAQEAIAKQRGQ